MNKEQNKCVILRKLMTILDNILMNGVNEDTSKHVIKLLEGCCGGGKTFDALTVDEFFAVDTIRQRVFDAVIKDWNEHVVLPFHVNIPTPAGTILFALHEYQHRYHEEDDPLLEDGLSTLEIRARDCIKEKVLSNGGQSFVQSAVEHVYQSAVAGHLHKMVYRLIDVRRALKDWVSAGYENIFIDYE